MTALRGKSHVILGRKKRMMTKVWEQLKIKDMVKVTDIPLRIVALKGDPRLAGSDYGGECDEDPDQIIIFEQYQIEFTYKGGRTMKRTIDKKDYNVSSGDTIANLVHFTEFEGKKDLIMISEDFESNYGKIEYIICRDSDGVIRKESKSVEEFYEQLTEEDIGIITEYMFERPSHFERVEINISKGIIVYVTEIKKKIEAQIEEWGKTRYYMYNNRYIVRMSSPIFYRLNDDMEWEVVPGMIDRYNDPMYDFDELTEEEVLKVYPREILEKEPLPSMGDIIKSHESRATDAKKNAQDVGENTDGALTGMKVPAQNDRKSMSEKTADHIAGDEPQKVIPWKVTLYEMDNSYESEEVTASLICHELRVTGITSERAPGERYGISIELSAKNTKKLMRLLRTDEEGLLQEMQRRFGGIGTAQSRFQEYCKKHRLKYKIYLV